MRLKKLHAYARFFNAIFARISILYACAPWTRDEEISSTLKIIQTSVNLQKKFNTTHILRKIRNFAIFLQTFENNCEMTNLSQRKNFHDLVIFSLKCILFPQTSSEWHELLKILARRIEHFSIYNRKWSWVASVLFTLLFDWTRKLAPSFQPVKCRTKTDPTLITRVFPRLKLSVLTGQ